MDFKQLRAFITIADTGNVTRAAELLNLVQPAVSRQLKLLEEDVGVPLFHRERHGMTLNDDGKALLAYARRAMLELDRARAEVGGPAQGVSGLVTVGLLPSTTEPLASALLGAVTSAHPGIRLRIASGYAATLQGWLETGAGALALLYDVERSPAIHTQPLLEEALWVVGPVAAKFRRNKPVALKALQGRPLILPAGPHGLRTLVDHACAVHKIRLDVAAETNAMSVQKSLVLGGHGLTVLPPVAVAEELDGKRLSAAPLCRPTITRTIVLASPANRALGAHVHRTVDLLVGCVRSAVRDGRWPEARWIGA